MIIQRASVASLQSQLRLQSTSPLKLSLVGHKRKERSLSPDTQQRVKYALPKESCRHKIDAKRKTLSHFALQKRRYKGYAHRPSHWKFRRTQSTSTTRTTKCSSQLPSTRSRSRSRSPSCEQDRSQETPPNIEFTAQNHRSGTGDLRTKTET